MMCAFGGTQTHGGHKEHIYYKGGVTHLKTLGVSSPSRSSFGDAAKLRLLLLTTCLLLWCWRARLALESEVEVVEEEGGPQPARPPPSSPVADVGEATDPL